MKNGLLDYLRRPYPTMEMSWPKAELLTCGLVALLFLIFEPFGVNSLLGAYRWLLIGGFVGASVLAIELVRWGAVLLFGKAYWDERHWTVGKNILCHLTILFFISVGIWSFLSGVSFVSGVFIAPTFASIVWNTLLVGIFPVGLLTVLIEHRRTACHVREASALNKQLEGSCTSATEEAIHLLVFPDGQKSNWELPSEDLVLAESDGNYVKVVYVHQGTLQRNLIRITMKQLEKSCSADTLLFRCHRAFVVNLRFVEQVKGNSQGYRLTIRGWKEEIPVARSYNKALRERLSNWSSGFHSSQI